MKKLSLFIVCLSALACSRPDFKAELRHVNQLDSLYAELQTEYAALAQIKQQDSAMKVINADLDFFKDKFDETNRATFREDVAWISNYRSIRKLVKGAGENMKLASKELAISAKQLKDLRQDLEEGNAEEEKVKGYIETERNALNLIGKSLAVLDSNQTEFMKNFEWMKPKIDSIKAKLN